VKQLLKAIELTSEEGLTDRRRFLKDKGDKEDTSRFA
jgi:hypothetical protein